MCANGAVRHSSSVTSRTASSAIALRRLREHARDPERQRDATLHVDRARPVQAISVMTRAGVLTMADDGVQVPEQHQPPAAGPVDPCDQVGREARCRARDPLKPRLVGQEGAAQCDRLLSPGEVAGRR